MSQKRDTTAMKYCAQQFVQQAVSVRLQELQVEKTATNTVGGTAGWQGQGADAFRERAKLLCEDLKILGQAFTRIGNELFYLIGQFETVNSLLMQVDRVQDEIDRLEQRVWRVDPERRASLHHELTGLRSQRSMLQHQADEIERRAQSEMNRRFDEIGDVVKQMHFADGVQSAGKGTGMEFSWSDWILPGAVLGLVGSGSVKFRRVPSNPNLYVLQMGDWLRGQTRYAWWNDKVNWINQQMRRIPMIEDSLEKAVKDYILGIDPNLTQISKWKMPMHLASRAVGALSVATASYQEFDSLRDSWKKYDETAQSRDEFWRNFSQDAASSLNRILWRSTGTIAGTAVGAVGGTAASGPAGGVVMGAVGGAFGEKFGKWVAEETDSLARDLGEKAGAVIADTLDLVDDITETVQEFDDIVKEAFPALFD